MSAGGAIAAAPRIPNFTGWLAGVTGELMETRFTKSRNQAIVVVDSKRFKGGGGIYTYIIILVSYLPRGDVDSSKHLNEQRIWHC